MSAASKPGKGGSRWGGFIEKTLASVESRLDTILAEEDLPPSKSNAAQQQSEKPTAPGGASPQRRADSRPDLSRSSSTAKANDRLQERLAKAVSRSNSPKPGDAMTISQHSDGPRSATPSGTKEEDTRGSLDSARDAEATESFLATREGTLEVPGSIDPLDRTLSYNESQDGPPIVVSEPAAEFVIDSSLPSSARASLDLPSSVRSEQISRPITPAFPQKDGEGQVTGDHAAALAKLQAQHEEAELKWKEELQSYVERMDAMQAKLLYLTKEASFNAKAAAADSQAGSLEKKLLERDEKIALLMEEGQKLSKTELNHLTTIKKLRNQALDSQKVQKDLRGQIEKADKERLAASERSRRAEAATKKAIEQAASASKNDREIEALSRERSALNATVADIKSQLARATSRAELAESRSQADALERERRQVAELRDDLSSQKVESELRENKLRRELKELKERLDTEKDVSRALETQLRGEQSVMERKMESLRSQAEEVTSSGDAQAKLLRQIETLQTQYAAASENWQGIEGSLLARLANVERERDDVVGREEDLRKKAREATLKAKRLEAMLEKSQEKIDDLERSLPEKQSEITKLTRKVDQFTDEISDMKRDFDKQLQAQENAFSQRLEDERIKWREQSTLVHNFQTASPVASTRKISTLELSHWGTPAVPSDRVLPTRRPSAFPTQVRDSSNTPPRHNSVSSFSRPPTNHGFPLDTPPLPSFDKDDAFSPATPSSPRADGVNDLISVSTVGAGPSVALVERMSANVRRLESERAASKDEMARITSQRDEARQEVVSLMREAEAKRTLEERLQKMEADKVGLDQRYQTTLEMLGEKSEMVEELKMDVGELKRIYRELVESTVK